MELFAVLEEEREFSVQTARRSAVERGDMREHLARVHALGEDCRAGAELRGVEEERVQPELAAAALRAGLRDGALANTLERVKPAAVTESARGKIGAMSLWSAMPSTPNLTLRLSTSICFPPASEYVASTSLSEPRAVQAATGRFCVHEPSASMENVPENTRFDAMFGARRGRSAASTASSCETVRSFTLATKFQSFAPVAAKSA